MSINQYEFESAMSDVLKNGDIGDIAEAAGKGSSYYSQMLNADDPRESIWWRTANDFSNYIGLSETRGTEALSVFNSFVSRAFAGDETLSQEDERRSVYTEWTEFVLSEAEKKPLLDQIKELEDHVIACERLLLAKRAEARIKIEPRVRKECRERVNGHTRS
jgi:hypothetical protein